MAKTPTKTETMGERIAGMRKRQKVDIETLAKNTGYSVEYLQRIESGKVAPAVGALIRISRALAIDSASLLAESARKERRRSYLKRTRAYSYRNLTPDAEDKHLWAYLVTLEPKKEHERVEYKHEGEEFVYVLQGRVELQVGGNATVLRKGAAFHFDSGQEHTLKNLSSKQSKLIVVVYTP